MMSYGAVSTKRDIFQIIEYLLALAVYQSNLGKSAFFTCLPCKEVFSYPLCVTDNYSLIHRPWYSCEKREWLQKFFFLILKNVLCNQVLGTSFEAQIGAVPQHRKKQTSQKRQNKTEKTTKQRQNKQNKKVTHINCSRKSILTCPI